MRTSGLVRRGMGDALTDAQSAARARVNAEAADYTLPSPAKTRSQAVMAFILLMRSAASENPTNAGHYKEKARTAAWDYREMPIANILSAAAGLTTSAPRTRTVALAVERASVATSKAAPKKKRRTSSAPVEYSPPVEDVPVPWYERLPSWAPTAAGAAGVGLLLFTLWPRSRS